MIKNILILIFFLLNLPLLAEDRLQGGKIETIDGKAEVIEVFSFKSKDGANYRSYLVKLDGSKVVVTDTFGASDVKVGEMIVFKITTVTMPFGPKGLKYMSFTYDKLPVSSKRDFFKFSTELADDLIEMRKQRKAEGDKKVEDTGVGD